MLKVVKPSDIESVIGTETGVSEWITIDQEQINKFAEATLDNQFIHVDPEAAKPVFGSTIAHAFYHYLFQREFQFLREWVL